MIDRLRRTLGLSDDKGATEDEREESDDSQAKDQQPRAPELVPRELMLRRGVSVTSVTLRATLVVVGVLLTLLVLYMVSELILIVVVALIVAAAMHGPVAWLERRGLPRVAAMLVAYGAVVAAVIAAGFVIGGPLLAEAQALFEDLPGLTEELRGQAVTFLNGLLGQGQGEEIMTSFEAALGDMEIAPLLEYPLQVLGALVNVVIIFFLSAFFVLERDRAKNLVASLTAPDKREPTVTLARSVLNSLARFVQGQLALMTIIGVSMTVALIVLGIPFALPLGVFAFLVEAIPMVGPWIAIVPAVAIALTQSPEQAILLLVFWFVIQQVEGYILTPMVMGHVQHLPPSVVLLSVLGGFELAGFFGAIIAVPVVAATWMVVSAVFVQARRQSLAGRGPDPVEL